MFDNNLDRNTLGTLIAEKIDYLRHLALKLSEDDPSVTLRTLWYLEQESSVLREIIAKAYIEMPSGNKENQPL